MARPLSKTWLDFASVFRASAQTFNTSTLPRTCQFAQCRRDLLRKRPEQRRGYLGQTQRRRATTSAEPAFKHPVIDHHYEYVPSESMGVHTLDADGTAARSLLELEVQAYVLP